MEIGIFTAFVFAVCDQVAQAKLQGFAVQIYIKFTFLLGNSKRILSKRLKVEDKIRI